MTTISTGGGNGHTPGCACPFCASNTMAAEAVGVDLTGTGPHADLTAIAVLNAIAEAKRTGEPALIEHPSGNRIDLDEQRTGNTAGDYSVGAEPSIRFTWATGSDDEPFVTVTETCWVSARLDNGHDDLDYDDWEAAKESREMWEADRDNPTCDCSLSSGRKGSGMDPARCLVHGDGLSRLTEPPTIRYGREDITEWIAHSDPNNPGSTEIRSEYEHGDGSALYFSARENGETEARRHLKWLEPSMYAPENWK